MCKDKPIWAATPCIAISPAAFEAIAATLPLGSVGYEPQLTGLFCWRFKMKYALTPILSTAAVCAFLCAAPTSANAFVRHAHAKVEQAQHYPMLYQPYHGYYAYPPGYYASVQGYPDGSVGGLHHPTGCNSCPPE